MAISGSAMIIAAVATAVAAAGTAYATYEQGKAQAEQYRAEAQQAEVQARAARQAASVRERQSRERTDAIRATARARAEASGVMSSEGSPLLVMMENARQAEYEANLIRYGGEVQARSFEDDSRLLTFRGRQARRSANIAAGATLLTGLAQAASILAKSPSSPSPGAQPGATAGATTSVRRTSYGGGGGDG